MQFQTYRPTIFRILSACCYSLSLYLPAIGTRIFNIDLNGYEIMHGGSILMLGFLGIFFKTIAWLANWTYFAGLLCSTTRGTDKRAGYALASLLLGLSTCALSSSGHVDYLIGFYLWMASFGLLLLAHESAHVQFSSTPKIETTKSFYM